MLTNCCIKYKALRAGFLYDSSKVNFTFPTIIDYLNIKQSDDLKSPLLRYTLEDFKIK